MNVLVLGATGMLGHQVVKWLLAAGFDVSATIRSSHCPPEFLQHLGRARLLTGIDVGDIPTLVSELVAAGPKVIVNCIGARGAALMDADQAWAINRDLPQALAAHALKTGTRLIHIGTDGVFSGASGPYGESAEPDPIDFYGQTKLAGEVAGPNISTLRLSMIGPELRDRRGLLDWARSQKGAQVDGYTKTLTTALSTPVIARLIAHLIATGHAADGIWHVSGPEITKADLLCAISDAFGLHLGIRRVDSPICDRRLYGQKFAASSGFIAPSWDAMLDELATG
jgi:dTDP-4-dehydrorhamnose reductase